MKHFEELAKRSDLLERTKKIKLVLTDCDGVLTDNGVYYSSDGEIMKRFSIRDGMGMERLRNLVAVETGIITGETSGSVQKRAEKLKLNYLYLGVKDKRARWDEILEETGLDSSQIAYIGDDVNDLEIMAICGLTASPANGMQMVREQTDFICTQNGGNGAFREFAEWIIWCKQIGL